MANARTTSPSNTPALRCNVCGNLETSIPLEYGHRLETIMRRATDGCQTCSLVGEAVIAIQGGRGETPDVKVGWDISRIQGLRIVVGAFMSSTFLHGIDMFSKDGRRLPTKFPSSFAFAYANSAASYRGQNALASDRECRKADKRFRPYRICYGRSFNQRLDAGLRAQPFVLLA